LDVVKIGSSSTEREVGIFHSVSDRILFAILVRVVGLLVVLDVNANAVNEFLNLRIRLTVRLPDALS